MITFTTEEKTRIDEIEKFLRFVHPTGLIEVRALGGEEHGTIRHLYSGHRVLAYSAIMAEQVGAPVYWCLNPIKADSKYAERNVTEQPIRHVIYAAGDKDILYRSNYLIDVDSVHPKGVCATDAEKAEAFAVATRIITFLRERGWPEPIVVDSGNGTQLVYKGDHCNPNSPAWAHVLRYLSKLFGTPGAKVDTVVHNAGRIARMPYTWNKKGECTTERPHRLATVVCYPAKWEPVNHGGNVFRLAREGGFSLDEKSPAGKPSGDRPELVEDIEKAIQAFIDEYPSDLCVAGSSEKDGRTYYHLRHCPFAGRPHSKSIPAIILGDDFVGFKCFSDECPDYGMSDLRDLLATRTGHRSKVRFYVEQPIDLDKISELWGGVDDLDDKDRPLSAAELMALLKSLGDGNATTV